jgi:hypothetical protein
MRARLGAHVSLSAWCFVFSTRLGVLIAVEVSAAAFGGQFHPILSPCPQVLRVLHQMHASMCMCMD